MTVNSGSGSDYVAVVSTEEGTTRIGGAVSIITGAGLDEVEFIAEADLTIVGALIFDTGSGTITCWCRRAMAQSESTEPKP